MTGREGGREDVMRGRARPTSVCRLAAEFGSGDGREITDNIWRCRDVQDGHAAVVWPAF